MQAELVNWECMDLATFCDIEAVDSLIWLYLAIFSFYLKLPTNPGYPPPYSACSIDYLVKKLSRMVENSTNHSF